MADENGKTPPPGSGKRPETPKASNPSTPPRKPVTIDLEAKDVTTKRAEKPTEQEPRENEKKPPENEKRSAVSGRPPSVSAKETPKSPGFKPDNPAKELEAEKKADTQKPPEKASATKSDPVKPKEASAKPFERGKPSQPPAAKATTPEKPSPQPLAAATTSGKKGGGFSAFLGAIAAGVIAVALFYGLQVFGMLPSPGANTAAIDAEISEIRTLAEDAQEAAESAETRANDAVAQAETQVEPVIPTDLTARLDALETRVAELEEGIQQTEIPLAESTAVPTSTVADAQVSALVERLDAFQARLEAAEDASNRSGFPEELDAASLADDLTSLQTRLTTLENDIASLGANAVADTTAVDTGTVSDVALQALTSRVADIEASLATTSSALTALENAAGTDLTPLQDALASVDQQLQETSDTVAVLSASLNETGDMVAALGSEVEAVQTGLSDAKNALNANRTAARALALSDLKAAADSGSALAPALTALETSGVTAERLSPIQPFAEDTVPDRATLDRSLQGLITQALSRQQPAVDGEVGGSSPAERLLENALSVINIRRIEPEGAPETPLGQMQVAFNNSDKDAFMKAHEMLSDEQKALFTDWLKQWGGYLALTALISDLETDILSETQDHMPENTQ